MLSSTLAFGLSFVLFANTIACRSHDHPVSSYTEQLRVVGPPGVNLNSSESKHAASDSIYSSSWLKDNLKRALNGTAMRNVSSLDAPRPALMDNSSDLVEASKSTPVVDDTEPTCYRPRRAAPIANPSHCNVAIYEIISTGEPEEAVLWHEREAWIHLTCKVELVPISEYASEYMTRSHLAQAATLIKRDCVTFQHGFRGGYVAVGLRTNFDLRIWASTSSITVNETTSAFSHLLDSPDPLGTGLDSPL